MMGWILSQLLDCCLREQLRSLRCRALTSAALLFAKARRKKRREEKNYFEWLVLQMREEPRVAASFFPGFVSALRKIACGDFKQGVLLHVESSF